MTDPSWGPGNLSACAQSGAQDAAVERLALYWRACGITDESRIEALCRRVWQRLSLADGQISVEELRDRVIREARALLDDELTKCPGLPHQSGEPEALRAAFLCDAGLDGAGWLRDGVNAGECLNGARRTLPRAVPLEPAPLLMEEQRIEYFEPRRPRALGTVLGHFGRLSWNRLLALVGYA
jgi:hypothetical protein